MPRIPHGVVIKVAATDLATDLDTNNLKSVTAVIPSVPATAPDLTRFGHLIPEEFLLDPANLLPEPSEGANTIANLSRLGSTMLDLGTAPARDSDIPAVYTYFAQFLSHDITLEAVTENAPLNNQGLVPIPSNEMKNIVNTRTATLDLDSIYCPALHKGQFYPVPRDDNKMLIERASESRTKPPNGVDLNNSDLPREKRSDDPVFDRAARIGDGRNDENLITSQLHLAFLRAHNAIVDQGKSFNEARKLLRQHYQWIVIHDFLTRMVDKEILQEVISGERVVYDPPDNKFFLPFEFTVAAFRFGHSMIRSSYNYNETAEGPVAARLFQLFMARALGRYHHIPERWIIQWNRFVEGGINLNVARQIDTALVNPLSAVLDQKGTPLKFDARLAVRDLIRGYLLRLPTGQAMARALQLPVMSAAEIEAVGEAVSKEQKQVLQETGFSSRTPLWFYILAEAAHFQKGLRLGPVGSALVAGVLVGLVRRSRDSILRYPNWTPTLGRTQGQFNLPDLLHLAGVLPDNNS